MADEPRRGQRKTPTQYKKLASLLGQEVPVGQALRQAGWSERQSMEGWDAVPGAVLVQLPKKATKLIALGKSVGKEERKALVRGRFMTNTIQDKDGGAQSAKILGSDSELNMWQPEFAQGLIVIQAPQYAIDRKAELLAEDKE
jgi:hypothetical protein